MRRLPRPPIDLASFIGRKWLEQLSENSNDFSSIANLQLLVLVSDPLLPNARQLIASSNVTLTDAGAGSTLTLNLGDTGVAPGTYNLVTVDAKGRITSGSSVTVITIVANIDGTLTVSQISETATVSLNLNHANTWLADQSVPDEVYGPSWNGSTEVPTKNSLYDKIETLGGGGGASSTDYTHGFLLGGM